jgi:hypothetical protein
LFWSDFIDLIPHSSFLAILERFSWGLRVLCVIDLASLMSSFFFSIPTTLLVTSCLFLWGPFLSYFSLTRVRPILLCLAILYHSIMVVAAIAASSSLTLWGVVVPVAYHAWIVTLFVRFLVLVVELNDEEIALVRLLLISSWG